MDLSFKIAAGPRQSSHSQVKFRETRDQILVSPIRDSPNLEGQVPVFISPRNRVARLYPQALGSLFVSSDERMGLSFTIAAGPRQHSHSQVWVPRNSLAHFTVSDLRLPQPGGYVPVFIFPGNRVARLYPQVSGSLFVASYNSQGYGGAIRPRLHTGVVLLI
jgi:hypothetical protein